MHRWYLLRAGPRQPDTGLLPGRAPGSTRSDQQRRYGTAS